MKEEEFEKQRLDYFIKSIRFSGNAKQRRKARRAYRRARMLPTVTFRVPLPPQPTIVITGTIEV